MNIFETYPFGAFRVKRQTRKKTVKTRKRAAKKAPRKVVKKAKKASLKAGDVLAGLSQYPEVMRPEEVQEVLRISRATFFRMVQSGSLKGALRVHGSWRCVRDVLRQWLIDQTS